LVLLAGAIALLRTPGAPPDSSPPPPPPISRFAADYIVLPPAPEGPPAAPTGLTVTTSPRLLRIAWADGVPGGTAPASASGYELTWHSPGAAPQTRLLVTPVTELRDLTDGVSYELSVRTIDLFGRRSAPATGTGTPGPADTSWRTGALTAYLDDFASQDSARAWHLAGYPGCVDPAWRDGDLTINLRCGADEAMLRSRIPLRLSGTGELARVAIITDTAGPGGQLTVDLIPGPADRTGKPRSAGASGVGDLLPGAIRVVVDDHGARVVTARDVPRLSTPPAVRPAPRRGAQVLDRFEVVLTSEGVRVLQNGVPVAVSGAVPSWTTGWVVFGLSGPPGVPAQVRVAAAGLSGRPPTAVDVAEIPLIAGIGRVLDLTERGPDLGFARRPLVGAAAARLITTITMTPGLDVAHLVAQLGEQRIPLRPAVPGPPPAAGTALTLSADLPPALLAAPGPDPVSPFVIRAPGATDKTTISDTYAEITPGPQWTPPPPAPVAPVAARPPDKLPVLSAYVANGLGTRTATAPSRETWLLIIDLDGGPAQWETGGLAGVRGLEVRLDGNLIAALPTATNGPGVGGRYVLAVNPGRLLAGPHTIEARELPATPGRDPISVLVTATLF
jgi:hypothetical protein